MEMITTQEELIIYQEAIKWLECTKCSGELDYVVAVNASYVCKNCKCSFPIIKGIPRFIEVDSRLLAEAKEHWEESPNFQYEAKSKLYTREYYEEQDKWRETEVEPFSMNEYGFGEVRGKLILDIGCGSGWVIKQAAKHGAIPIGIDFTDRAVTSSFHALQVYRLKGLVIQANAERLPIKTGIIEKLYSIGVLHHLPSTEKGVDEAYRVLALGGNAFISMYGRLFFINSLLFPVAQFFLRKLFKAPAVRDGLQYVPTYDEFYKLLDGPKNPIGRWYTRKQLRELFGKFELLSINTSYFPLRYLKIGSVPLGRIIPRVVHRLLDTRLGVMRNMQLHKARHQ